MNQNFGMKVTLKLANGNEMILRNVTEIHYGYPSRVTDKERCAFESDIQLTGITFDCKEIQEFETELECGEAPDFDER